LLRPNIFIAQQGVENQIESTNLKSLEDVALELYLKQEGNYFRTRAV